MKRREFLQRTACAAGALSLHASAFARSALALPALPQKFSASDNVTLGKTGIQTSRLAMGTGTVGVRHHSHQTPLGLKTLSHFSLTLYTHHLPSFTPPHS